MGAKNGKKQIEALIEALGRGEGAAEEQLRALYDDAPRTFGEGFADRVAERLADRREPGVAYFLPRMFKWVAVAGIAAAVALLVVLYLNEQAVSMDAFAGIDALSINDVTALNSF